jgi:hypothetical protein
MEDLPEEIFKIILGHVDKSYYPLCRLISNRFAKTLAPGNWLPSNMKAKKFRRFHKYITKIKKDVKMKNIGLYIEHLTCKVSEIIVPKNIKFNLINGIGWEYRHKTNFFPLYLKEYLMDKENIKNVDMLEWNFDRLEQVHTAKLSGSYTIKYCSLEYILKFEMVFSGVENTTDNTTKANLVHINFFD